MFTAWNLAHLPRIFICIVAIAIAGIHFIVVESAMFVSGE